MTAAPLLAGHHLGLSRNGRVLLDHVDLSIAKGEIVTIIGPNGAGKTTLLRLLLGLDAPTTGHVTRAPGLKIGYMPQKLAIDPTLPLTVRRFMTLWHGGSDETVKTALAEVGVKAKLDQAIQSVSGGELQRILLARTLLGNPDLLVLDEPVQGVDVSGQAELYALITHIRTQRGCGVLLVSHDLHIVMAHTDKVICLNRHICCAGHPETVSKHPDYLALFGPSAAALAVYTHHHDHDHHHD